MNLSDYFDNNDFEWTKEAECKGTQPNLWFPNPDTDNHARLPKQICNMCAVQIECLEYAITTRQKDGIWGGMTEQERERLIKRRRRGLD